MSIENYRIQDYRDALSHIRMVSRYGLSKMPPLIISCAITGGVQGKQANPNLPETPEEQAQQAYDAYCAGASVIHIHARDPKDTSKMTTRVEDYQKVNALIRRRCPDVIINNTCGGVRYITKPDGEHYQVSPMQHLSVPADPEIATIDITCMANRLRGNITFMAYQDLEAVVDELHEKGIKAEFECWKPDDFKYLAYLQGKGKLDDPYLVQMLFGGNGTFPIPEELLLTARTMPENGMLSVIGIGACQTAMVTQAILMGHHVRVGMEDNVYYGYRQLAEDNAQFVKRVVRLAKDLGRPVATPAQAREMMGLSALPKSYEFAHGEGSVENA